MKPIDLTKAPPRSPREELVGLCMLPRMIDIARAKLPGGDVGQYQIGRGMSGLVLRHLGMEVGEFVELIRNAELPAILARAQAAAGPISGEIETTGPRPRRLLVHAAPLQTPSQVQDTPCASRRGDAAWALKAAGFAARTPCCCKRNSSATAGRI